MFIALVVSIAAGSDMRGSCANMLTCDFWKKFLWARDAHKVPSIISISLLGGVPGVEGYGRGSAHVRF
jgi:hypothetical protein